MKRMMLASSLLILAACSQSPRDRLVKSLQTTRSWTATAQMIAETWQQGRIPDQYAEQALEKSQQEIAKETQDLSPQPAVLQPLARSLQQLHTDVQQQRKTTIAATIGQLAVAQQQLDAAIRAQGATP